MRKLFADFVRAIRNIGYREPCVKMFRNEVIGHCDCTPTTCICWEREQELRQKRAQKQ